MKKIALIILIVNSFYSKAQRNDNHVFGNVSNSEITMTKYSADTTANAVVLYEIGKTRFRVDDSDIFVRTTFYYKIKIFNKEGYKHGSFVIPLYKSNRASEKIENIRAHTFNRNSRTTLDKKNIIKNTENKNLSTINFTLPDLKPGCIIEVEYTVESPFKFNLTGWEFQSEIPKISSFYQAEIPGNYVYNRKLKGYLKLTTNSAVIKKNCLRFPGYKVMADCEVLQYGMTDIPAFEDEPYMTDPDNFKARIEFELSEHKLLNGSTKTYTSTWKAVDKEFKSDRNIGGQLKKMKIFKDKIPDSILSINDDLERAKSVYSYIKDLFTWDNKFRVFKDVGIKETLDKGVGNASEINIALINALKYVKLDAKLVLLSTRNNGFPTKIHPVISDFNYVIAQLTIGNKSYFLDATDKLMPFGLIPFRCLNGSGRVMDFENESYWTDIKPNIDSKRHQSLKLSMNENGEMRGELNITYYGYNAHDRRSKIWGLSEDPTLEAMEYEYENVELVSYKIKNKSDLDKPLIETFEILISECSIGGSKCIFYPTVTSTYENNPFKQENRLYPVDFGYPWQEIVNFTLSVPENVKITDYPDNKSLKLENQAASFRHINRYEGNVYEFNSTLKINKPVFYNYEYPPLKNLFGQMLTSINTPVLIEFEVNNKND